MEKTMIRSVAAYLSVLLLCSCGGAAKGGLGEYDTPLYTPGHAVEFSILGAQGRQSSVLTTHSPWQGADAAAATHLFIARGGECPPEGFAGQCIEAGARRVVCLSSSHVAFIDALGDVERIVGVTNVGSISNPAIHSRGVGEIGYDASTDYERLAALRPDLVMLYGVKGASGMERKLRELGIPFVYIGEYLERSPLGKAEWLVAVAEILDCREEGERLFAEIAARYHAMREAVATTGHRPKVMLNMPYGDSWFMPSTDSYVARLIEDAGGDYLYRRNSGGHSLPIDMERALLLASQADVWLNFGGVTTLAQVLARLPEFAGIRAVREGRLYNDNLRLNEGGGNDYWESGVVHPDIVLRDLALILHPELFDPGQRTYYYRHLE